MTVGLIVSVEVPDPVMLDVLSIAVTPVGLDTVNATVDPNPFRRLRLMVEVPWDPVLIETLVGLAVRVKSRNVKAAVVV